MPNQRIQLTRARFAFARLIVSIAFTIGVCAAEYTVHVVDPPITNHLILREGPLPPVCEKASVLELRACPGEYEPGSFVVTTGKRLDAVRIESAALTGDGGTLPGDAVDIRLVKAVYRGTLYEGYSALVPTLLVHDDDFLAVEPAPTEKDPKRMTNVLRGQRRDSRFLKPVTIERRRQFWVTVHVPEDARPGTYSSKLRILPQNAAPTELKLQVNVYPFTLKPPMIEYSMYYPVYLGRNLPPDDPHSFGDITDKQYVAELKNMMAHGLSNPNIYQSATWKADGSLDFSMLDRILTLREKVGMRPPTLYLLGHGVEFYDRPLKAEERRRTDEYVRQLKRWARARGYPEMFIHANDEWWGDQLKGERDSFIALDEAGGKAFVAVMQTPFYDQVGDVLHRPVLNAGIGKYIHFAARKYEPAESLHHWAELAKAGSFDRVRRDPRFRKAIDGMHRYGNRIYTYMNPVAGMPLPELQRRNEGLGLWRVGFDGTMTWAYTHITGDPVNQAMMFSKVYRTDDGVLDTLCWEGYREGVDDVRYLTTLNAALTEAAGRFPDDPLIADTHAWIRAIDAADGDLDAIRSEMARRITALRDLGYHELTPQEALAEIDLERVDVITFPEPWRFKIDPDDKGVAQKWFDPALDDNQWPTVRTDKQIGWDKQGFEAVGYGWYRAPLPAVAVELEGKHTYIYFEGVDEQGWVYLNGTKCHDQTVEVTGLLIEELWLTPFSVSLTDMDLHGNDLLAVRIHNSTAMGGIWKPVHLILSDQAMTSRQLHALIKLRKAKAE